MTESGQSRCSASFAKRDVAAAPERAAQIRHEFSNWLRGHFTLDPIRASDVVLAVNEALANAAEFAYATAQQPGVMHMQACYDESAAVLTVTVTDEGAWRRTDPETRRPTRGRGIPLMHALTDQATFDSTPTGTEVRLQWNHVLPMGSARAQNFGSRTT